MYVVKRMLILLIFVYCLNLLISADTNKDETWPDLFSGKGEDIWIVVKDLDGGPYEYKSTLYDERLFDPDNDFQVKWWLRQSFKDGYGEYRYDEVIAGHLHETLRKIAWKVQDKIDNCQVLQNMYGDKIRGKKKYPLSFQYYKNNACGDTMSISVRMSNLLLHKILKDIGEQLRNGAEEIQVDFSKYTCNGNDILDVWGHETLHAITGAGEPSEVDECFVHCLTKKCIAENPDDYVLKKFQTNQGGNIKCNEITEKQWEYLIDRTGDVDPREEMKAGDCFCDEKWTEDAECDENNPGPPIPEWGSAGSSGTDRKSIAYFPDLPDDHYSFSDFIEFSDKQIKLNSTGNFLGDTIKINDSINFSFYPDILLYNKYGTSLTDNLLNRVMPGNYFDDYVHDYFSNNHKILFIPSAALIGDSESELVNQAVTRFLEGGGSVVLFSQQFGKDIEKLIPLPGVEIGPIVGFREDQSCLKNSAYFSEMHPILSSSTTGILDVGIDGYFTVSSSSNATVLLRRKINDEPALLYYKYGQGTVFLTSLFTDYAYSRSMASTTELKLVKNMLRFAMAPDAYIPMFNLDENPNPTINLNIRVANQSEKPAAKAKISVYTIDNTPVYETEVSVSLNPGESADIPITFTLPDLETKDYGIGFSVFELKDADGNLIQLKTETPTGRFSIYKLLTPANINDGLYRWITVDDEIAYWGEDIECKIHLKNTSDQVKQLEVNNPYFQINHTSNYIGFESFSAAINPDETYEHVVYLSTKDISLMGDEKVTFRIKYRDPEGNLRQLSAAKAVFVKKALTQSTLELNTPYAVAPGASLDYSLHSFSDLALAGETTVKLALEKYNRENSTYAEIETLFQGTHDYSVNGDFQHTGTYTPETVHPSGSYRLKLEVTAPNGVKELTRYQDFFYDRSGFKVTPGSVKPLRWLVPGESYTIPVYVRNISSNNDYHVTNGLCILRLLSPGNQEIVRKDDKKRGQSLMILEIGLSTLP